MRRKRTYELLRSDLVPPDEDRVPTIVGLSECGSRHERNEDQFLVATLERSIRLEQSAFVGIDPAHPIHASDDAPVRLLMVADGMGGHEAGDVASAVVVDAIAHYAFSMMPWMTADTDADSIEAVDAALRKAVRHAQRRVAQVAERKGLSPHLGSTLTMACVCWPILQLVHVGDSRAYLFRDGVLFRLTRDHNLAGEMVRSRVLTPEQARNSRYSSMLTNAVAGSRHDVEAELHRVELAPGDRFLLCTDGLHGAIDDRDLSLRIDHVNADEDVAPMARALIDEAKARGATDDVTLILARF